MDYKSQAQTIDHLIVDIGKTTSFSLNPFNAYIALSRSHGWSSIRLLRDFENTLFTQHPSDNLKREDERLSFLAKQTKVDYYWGMHGPTHGISQLMIDGQLS